MACKYCDLKIGEKEYLCSDVCIYNQSIYCDGGVIKNQFVIALHPDWASDIEACCDINYCPICGEKLNNTFE